MDLFDRQAQEGEQGKPLAARMRPVSLEEFVGQRHLVGEGRFLSTMIERDHAPSMILWGPPGTGKTSLAAIIAAHTKSEFIFYSAVLGSVKEIRSIIAAAAERLKFYKRRTILFVDEIHRFNKAQQDAFLPYVERGVITLIGATTENPSFEVNAALLSRCRTVVLKALASEDLQLVVERALTDESKGLAGRFSLDKDALQFLVEGAYGDARRALSTLESACEFAEQQGVSLLTLKMMQEAQQRKALLYDKGGEEHYNVISAFIKSLRGSDPDAAVYWMMRMLEAGEDPMFILRRMIVFAAEDVSNADPQALQLAVAAQQAFHFIGLPEGVIPMSHAATYLACAPKSNASYRAQLKAKKDIIEKGPLPVPMHLRNAPTKLMKNLGYSKGYKYPHDYEGNYVPECYLPDEIRDRRYYQPSENGEEKNISRRLARYRSKDQKAEPTAGNNKKGQK